MDFSTLGPWIMGIVAVPTLVVAFIAVLALRGSRPEHRAEILTALAVLAAALVLRRSPPARSQRALGRSSIHK